MVLFPGVRNERPTAAFVPDHMGQRDDFFQGAERVSSSRDGAQGRAAQKRTADPGGIDEDAKRKGITRITSEERDPIASALRRVYNDAATEPLPEDLSRLLSRLEAAEKDA